MSAAATLPTIDFSAAKARLSDVMSSVVREHQPQLIQRHGGKEAMLLVRPDDLARALSAYRFNPGVVFSEGEVTIVVEELGILGFGDSFEEALEDTVVELRRYAEDFFENVALYGNSNRAGHWPWLLRFALTPPDQQRDLLVNDARPANAPPA
jgi:hypothetical protein